MAGGGGGKGGAVIVRDGKDSVGYMRFTRVIVVFVGGVYFHYHFTGVDRHCTPLACYIICLPSLPPSLHLPFPYPFPFFL